MADVFISYKKEDRALAEAAVKALEGAGYSVWWDDRITPTEHWDRLIEREIDQAKAILVLWTARSVESDWVRIEANFAAEQTKLVQVRFGACRPPLAYSMLQRVDLEDGAALAGPAWEKALGWIALLAGRSETKREAQNDATQANKEFFDNTFGFSKGDLENSDLAVPIRLKIAQAMTGLSYEIGPFSEVANPVRMRVEIPAGVDNGTKIRLSGRGARRGDGTVGDLYLVIGIHDDGPFRLEDRDLHLDVPLSASQAAAGVERDIRLPGGRLIRATVPPGVTDGKILRLNACGLPARGIFPAGDVLLHLKVS